ncbi:MAG: DUF1456 family protein [Nitrospirota bacterium]|nr:DUF1456 family protein [Nitrospirota bacterium]MDH5774764.1 DUF1456 family protein [Nitrospirota bacterium]
MTNNDCLRRIRYILDLSDSNMMDIFAQANQDVTRAEVSVWLKKDDEADFEKCPDVIFATFLNGLIQEKRGKKEGTRVEPEQRLNNNIIFMKLKIAFNLQAEGIVSILALAGLRVSKSELSAFFRRPDHKHFRKCQDQILRNFLKGLQLQYRHKLDPDDVFE